MKCIDRKHGQGKLAEQNEQAHFTKQTQFTKFAKMRLVHGNPVKKYILLLLTFIVIGSLALAIKPIRKVVMKCSIRLLECVQNRVIDETPNIAYDQLSIRTVEGKRDEIAYDVITREKDAIYSGDLILVNSDHIYQFTQQDQLLPLKTYKNHAYKIMTEDMYLSKKMLTALNLMMNDFEDVTDKHDMIITSAYRSLSEQQEAFEEKVAEYGIEEAPKWAMAPGYSEHHIGYAADMSIYTDDEIYVAYEGQDEYAWINQNCFKYGIVRRYTEDKTEITGISNEPWHYRYVGIPHAYLMVIQNMCLEEYIDYIRKFSYEDKHLRLTVAEGCYEIYYVAASEDGTSFIPVPKNLPYTISGNNVDGFIITITL